MSFKWLFRKPKSMDQLDPKLRAKWTSQIEQGIEAVYFGAMFVMVGPVRRNYEVDKDTAGWIVRAAVDDLLGFPPAPETAKVRATQSDAIEAVKSQAHRNPPLAAMLGMAMRERIVSIGLEGQAGANAEYIMSVEQRLADYNLPLTGRVQAPGNFLRSAREFAVRAGKQYQVDQQRHGMT